MNESVTPQEAQARYLRLFLPTMIVYAVSCFVVPELLDRLSSPIWLRVSLGLIPAIAIWVCLWSQARYFRESDEYQRKVLAESSLIGLAFTMALTTGWGFLEVHLGLTRFPLLMVLPTFYLFFGLSSLFARLRESRLS